MLPTDIVKHITKFINPHFIKVTRLDEVTNITEYQAYKWFLMHTAIKRRKLLGRRFYFILSLIRTR